MTKSVAEVRCSASCRLLGLLGLALNFAVVAPVWAEIPGQCSAPVAERKSELGCYVDANEELGELPRIPLFWHIYNFRSSAAAHAVKGRRSTVVEAFGRVWLYTIAEKGWHAASGTRVAVVGPLPTVSGKKYTARYMEAAFTAGMQARVHRHSGAEAFYLVTGVQCLETPSGIAIAHAGESFVVPEGPPMTVRSVGAETRRSIVLVLHDTSQPWQTLTNEWTPPGSCPE